MSKQWDTSFLVMAKMNLGVSDISLRILKQRCIWIFVLLDAIKVAKGNQGTYFCSVLLNQYFNFPNHVDDSSLVALAASNNDFMLFGSNHSYRKIGNNF